MQFFACSCCNFRLKSEQQCFAIFCNFLQFLAALWMQLQFIGVRRRSRRKPLALCLQTCFPYRFKLATSKLILMWWRWQLWCWWYWKPGLFASLFANMFSLQAETFKHVFLTGGNFQTCFPYRWKLATLKLSIMVMILLWCILMLMIRKPGLFASLFANMFSLQVQTFKHVFKLFT